MINILDPILCGIFAARVANRLIDLGIQTPGLDETSSRELYLIERDERKKMNPHEAAAYFFCSNFPNFPSSALLYQGDSESHGAHSLSKISEWAAKGKIRPKLAIIIKEELNSQLERCAAALPRQWWIR